MDRRTDRMAFSILCGLTLKEVKQLDLLLESSTRVNMSVNLPVLGVNWERFDVLGYKLPFISACWGGGVQPLLGWELKDPPL